MYVIHLYFLSMITHPPSSTLFPYTTLFRSTAVSELRARYKERFEKDHGVKLGFMSFFVKASIEALKKFPVVNAAVDGDDIVYHEYYDIGVAVSTDRGLVRSEEHTSEFQSLTNLVCRLLLE